jgi:hypothetical protein
MIKKRLPAPALNPAARIAVIDPRLSKKSINLRVDVYLTAI